MQTKSEPFAFLGSLPAILGRPQNHMRKIVSGIVDWCHCRLVSLSKKYTKSKLFGQGQQEPQSIDGTDGHQNTLILLFLLQ